MDKKFDNFPNHPGIDLRDILKCLGKFLILILVLNP